MKIKAPKYFVKLYDEAKKEQDYVLNFLEKKFGYGRHWIVKNIPTCLQKMDKNKKLELLDKMEKAKVITDYAWSRFNYENWDKHKDYIRFGPEKYDQKKKIIILTKSTKLKKFIKGLENLISKFGKKHEPKKSRKN